MDLLDEDIDFLAYEVVRDDAEIVFGMMKEIEIALSSTQDPAQERLLRTHLETINDIISEAVSEILPVKSTLELPDPEKMEAYIAADHSSGRRRHLGSGPSTKHLSSAA